MAGNEEFLRRALLIGAERYLEEPAVSRALSKLIPTYVSGPADFLSPAFALGCADYLREPWRVDELLARLRPGADTLEWQCRGRRLQLKGATVCCGEREMLLASAEQRLLRLLVLNRGEPVDRQLLETVANSVRTRRSQDSRALDICISRLRGKLFRLLDLDDSRGPIIASVYGIGYLLECG